jgi:site-specific DNA recombinase
MRKFNCAMYCRKSSAEGLDQAFNSLHAQREACLSYIESQRHEGWIALDDHYDDPGFSGGSTERPGLQRLLRDVEASKVDTVNRVQDRSIVQISAGFR